MSTHSDIPAHLSLISSSLRCLPSVLSRPSSRLLTLNLHANEISDLNVPDRRLEDGFVDKLFDKLTKADFSGNFISHSEGIEVSKMLYNGTKGK